MIEQTLEEIFKKLFENNIAKITVDYNGGNDEGYFENLQLHNKEKQIINVNWEKLFGEDTKLNDDVLADLIAEDEKLNQYGSFAGDYSCHGTLTINTETGDFDDDGEWTTYESNNNSGNIYGDAA